MSTSRLVGLPFALLAMCSGSAGDAHGDATPGGSSLVQEARPVLEIPRAIPATAGGRVPVPIGFRGDEAAISAVVFSIDFDEGWLAIDATDSDEDGVPDAVAFGVPEGLGVSAMLDASDRDGELDIVVADLAPPMASLPDGTLVTVTLEVGLPPGMREAAVGFSGEPPPSFGDTAGRSVPGGYSSGSVLIRPALWLPHIRIESQEE